MRLPRLVAGLVAVGLVGLAPLTVTAPAHAATFGSTTTLSFSAPYNGTAFDIGDDFFINAAVVGADGRSLNSGAGGPAYLQIYTAAAPTWTTIATDPDASSIFFTGVVATTNAQYKVVYQGGGTSGFGSSANTVTGSESPVVSIAVARALKIKTSRLTIKGKVKPSLGKEKVVILAKKGKKYKKYTTVKTSKKGAFTFNAPRRNQFKFAVVVPSNALYTGAVEYYVVTIF